MLLIATGFGISRVNKFRHITMAMVLASNKEETNVTLQERFILYMRKHSQYPYINSMADHFSSKEGWMYTFNELFKVSASQYIRIPVV